MLKRFMLVCAAGVAALAVVLAVGSGPARADTSTSVSPLVCDSDGGSTTVPAGDVTLHLGGYAQGTYGLIHDVLLAQTTTLQVGTTTYDLSGHWSAPVFNTGGGFWAIRQPDFDLGPLATGQSVTVSYNIAFSRPVAVLFPPVGSSGFNGPFVITGEGPFNCTITAV
jgi:hypothetical protein